MEFKYIPSLYVYKNLKKSKKQKAILIFTIILIVLNFMFILKKYDHKCNHKDNCPICIMIHQEEMNIIALTLRAIPVYLWFRFINNKIIKNKKWHSYIQSQTLVDLKIRLDN